MTETIQRYDHDVEDCPKGPADGAEAGRERRLQEFLRRAAGVHGVTANTLGTSALERLDDEAAVRAALPLLTDDEVLEVLWAWAHFRFP